MTSFGVYRHARNHIHVTYSVDGIVKTIPSRYFASCLVFHLKVHGVSQPPKRSRISHRASRGVFCSRMLTFTELLKCVFPKLNFVLIF